MLDYRRTGAARGYLGLACPPRYQVEGIGAFVVRGRQSGDLLFRRRRRLRQIKGQIGKAASRGERCSCGGPYERHTTYDTSACKRIRPKHKGAPVHILGLPQL